VKPKLATPPGVKPKLATPPGVKPKLATPPGVKPKKNKKKTESFEEQKSKLAVNQLQQLVKESIIR
jgi:hypothetical protein